MIWEICAARVGVFPADIIGVVATALVEVVPVEVVLVEVVVEEVLPELFKVNVALTVVGAVIAKEQIADEPQGLLKLANVDPLLGTAMTVTFVPGANCMQFAPQDVPTGVMATLPLPFPLLEVVRLTTVLEDPVPVDPVLMDPEDV